MFDIALHPRKQIIQSENSDAFGEKAIAHMGPDESSRPRYHRVFQHNLECSIIPNIPNARVTVSVL